jgi:signal transduction histidine kinase
MQSRRLRTTMERRMNLRVAPKTPAKNLDEELLRLFARLGRRVPIAVVLAAAMIVKIAEEDDADPSLLFKWLTLVVIVVAIRWVGLEYLANRIDLSEKLRMRIVAELSALAGVTHALSLMFFPLLHEFHRAIQSMLLVALCAAAVATMVGYMPVFLSYVLPIMIPLALIWAYSPGIAEPGWIEHATALCIVLYLVTIIIFARDAFRLFCESFEIRLQHLQLNRQLQAALVQAEAANRAKTRFLAFASHDLRQPMQSLVVDGASLMTRPLDEETRGIADRIRHQVEVVKLQINALLDISKLDAGVIKANRIGVPLRQFLQGIRNEFTLLASAKDIEMQIDCAADVAVNSDPLHLARMLRNLFDNAIKYTDSGYVRATATVDGNDVLLSIADSGQGISKDEQLKVFEEFYQVNNPERDSSRGLGLGLSIVQRLADLLEITLELESNLGAGSTFKLRIPAACMESTADPPHSRSLPSLTGMSILVVDDNKANLEAMKLFLEGQGCTVRVATGTDEAMTTVGQDKPDVVLADYRLRGNDSGIKTVQGIHQIYPRLPAILVSGDTDSDLLRAANDAEIPLLHKPIDIEALKQAIFDAKSS